MPIRHLLMQHADETSPTGIPVNSKIGNSFEFVDELMALERILRSEQACRG